MLNWATIPLVNWVRYAASILLTSFLPGYLFLKVIDRKKILRGGVVLVLSYLCSLFITFLSVFSSLLFTSSTGSSFTIIVSITIPLIILNLVKTCKINNSIKVNLNLVDLLFVISILSVVLIGSLLAMVSNLPITPGDMRLHHGFALDLSDGFPVYGDILVTYSGGYLFHLYLNGLGSLSGVPLALSIHGLYFLSFIPVLAFYSLVKVWLKNCFGKRLIFTSTFMSILLGFGGLYLCSQLFWNSNSLSTLLPVVTQRTYDIYMRILYLPDLVAPIWNIGLPCLFALLFLMKIRSPSVIRALIVPILVCLGYMAHISEVFFFSVIALLSILLINNKQRIGQYLVLGLVLVACIDFIAPSPLYVINSGISLSLTYLVTFALAILIISVEFFRYKNLLSKFDYFMIWLKEKVSNSWFFIKWVLVYFYCLSFIVWLVLYPNYNLWSWGGFSYTPFFVFPLRFGVVGLLALFSLFCFFKEIVKKNELSLFLLLIPVGFILEQFGNYYPIYPAYRYATIAFIGACVIAAYGLLKIIDRLKQPSIKRVYRIMISVFLVFLIFSGVFSTSLFYVNTTFYSNSNKITQNRLDALEFLRDNTPNNSSVLTFTKASSTDLSSFAGLNSVQNAYRWSKLLLSTTDPSIITHIFSKSNIKFVYLTQNDFQIIKSTQLHSFLKYFKIVVRNDYASIYEVPSLSASSSPSFAVLNFSPSLEVTDRIWIDDSFDSDWDYYRKHGAVKDFSSAVVDDQLCISFTSNQSGVTYVSYLRSNLSLSTNDYPILKVNYNVINSQSLFTIQLWNSTDQVFFYIGHLSSTEFADKTSSLPVNQTVNKIELIVETKTDSPINTTVGVQVDFIKFYTPINEWYDSTSSDFWSFYRTYGDVSNYSMSSVGEMKKISVTSNQNGKVWASYSIPMELVTKNSVLSFKYKVDNDFSRFTVILQNDTTRFFYYIGDLKDNDFKTLSFLLPDGQKITRIELLVETTENSPYRTNASIQVGNIKIFQRNFSENDILPALFVSLLNVNNTPIYVDNLIFTNLNTYIKDFSTIFIPCDPSFSVPEIVEWLSAGKTLIVLSMNGPGFFADYFEINSISSPIIVKNVNSGKVIYIDSSSLLIYENGSALIQPELLEEISILLSLNSSAAKVTVLPVYNSNHGSIQFNGALEISTSTLLLNGNLTLVDSSLPIKEVTTLELYGNITVFLENISVSFSPLESSYLLIKPTSYPIAGRIFIESNDVPNIMSNSSITYEFNDINVFDFYANDVSIFALLPSIYASGTMTFEELDVHSSLYVPLNGIYQKPVAIIGNVQFVTLFINNPIILFSTFAAQGTIDNLSSKTILPTIPWIDVLCSPYNFLLNIVFFLGLIISYVLKKKHLRITIRKK